MAAAALITGLIGSNAAWALGLGRLNVQSALGEPLRAEIDVSSLTPDEASSLAAKIASPDAYRAAGVEFNPALSQAVVSLQRRADGSPFLRIVSDRQVQEPFVDVILDLSWNTGKLVREYTLLFDPPPSQRATAAAPTPPVATPSTAASGAPRPAPRAEVSPTAPPVPAARAAAPAAPRPAAPAKPAEPPATAAADKSNEYRVRAGDTLTGIAARTQRPGVSLDQMLVGLYQGNQQAFIDNNMNLLRSGSVLSIPSTDTVKAITPDQARQTIQAQSADFAAYRQKLAAGVPIARAPQQAGQASGQVQAEVKDAKPGSTAAADKLMLDKGRAGAKGAPAIEDKVAQAREKKEATSRVGELARNLDELKKLQAASSAAGLSQPKPPVAAASSAIVVAKAPVGAPPLPSPAPAASTVAAPAKVAAAPASAPAAPPPPSAPASAPAAPAVAAVASAPAAPPAPPPAASTPPVVEKPATDTAAAKPADAASAPIAAAASAAEPTAEEPGFLASLLDNQWTLPGAGLLAIALAAFGWMRLRGAKKTDSGETSFLESRLQPDSFFGASGGQRVDTRDATGAPSSMSYSLSQLDAIGDVDPVAEADVYLAYGRDLQAEEILKEAMRADPQRLAIRTKLLEVYAKRRDSKGFELLATQLYGLTGGQGEDWAKAQELGRGIDPENSLYVPGGQPTAAAAASTAAGSEMLGVSTMPQSVVPSPSRFDMGHSGIDTDSGAPPTDSGVDLDLDLDLSTRGDLSEPEMPTIVRAAPSPAVDSRLDSVPPKSEFGLVDDDSLPSFSMEPAEAPAPAPAPATASAPMSGPGDFDLGSLSLDLDSDATVHVKAPAAPAPAVPAEALPSLEGFDMPGDADGADPLLRKLELADEFRQIGDVEGARDLLQEVVDKAQGALKSKAQSMLEALG